MATETNDKDSATTKEEPKVDERAVKLANQTEGALAQSAKAEGDILSNQKLGMYAKAGDAHLETIRCGKASIDYSCEARGVASTWSPSYYEDMVDSITTRVRATHPELFTDFDALKEKPSSPSKNRERIHARVLVGIVAKHLLALIGEKVWDLPYRLVANYLISDRVLKFSKSDVVGELRSENAEFLKTQLTLIVNGKQTSASFLNALKSHFADVDRAKDEAASANLTPAEKALRESAAKEGKKAAEVQNKVGTIRKTLAVYLAKACSGMMPPEEIAKMVGDAARTAKVSLPIGKLNPKNVTKEELNSFLEQVALKGGRSIDERKALRLVIVRHGNILAQQVAKKKQQAQATANGKPQLAAAI